MKFSKIVTVAAALAIGGLVTSAHAELNSGALSNGGQCWKAANFNGMGFGYWDACPAPQKAQPVRRAKAKAAKKD